MPFTFSHPAIVLPLIFLPKKWYSLTGLVIGSLTPDFEYFIRMKVQSDYSHTIGGLFWFDLPLGLLLAFLFHNIVRNTLFNNLPLLLRSRVAVFRQFDWNRYFRAHWFAVIISILTGAASHLFWDSFTHDHGYFAEIIPALSSRVGQIPVLKILQHGSTLLGGLTVILAILQLPRDHRLAAHFSVKYWSVLIIIAFVIILTRFLSGLDFELYGHVIVTGISALLISLVLTPLIISDRVGLRVM